MLLFMTNFFAILLAGSTILALLGLSAATTHELHGQARRRAILLIVVGTLLVAVPLAATSLNVATSARLQTEARKVAESWLDGSTYEVDSIGNTADGVVIRVGGEGDPPPSSELIAAMEEKIEQETGVRLEIVPERVEEFVVSVQSESE